MPSLLILVCILFAFYSEALHGKKCSCGAKVDRDLNGARGIFLCALVDLPDSFSVAVAKICSW